MKKFFKVSCVLLVSLLEAIIVTSLFCLFIWVLSFIYN